MEKYPRKFLPNLPRYEPESMDHTATKEFKTCARKYFLRMVLGRTLPSGQWASVFAWGSAIHKFVEMYCEGKESDAAVTALKMFRSPTKPAFDFQTKDQLMLAMSALMKMLKTEKMNGNIHIEAIEQPFKIKLPDGIYIGGRMDQVVKWNGRLWIRDWKTTSKQLQYFKSNLEPNDQATRYIYALSCLHFGMDEEGMPLKLVDGVIFHAIYLNKTIAKKNQGPELHPVPSSRNKYQVREWLKDQMFIHTLMQRCREEDIWPKNEGACTFCDYKMVCNQPSEAAMENTLKSQYLLEPWKHEEVDQKEIV